jgi:hypothetical protein
MKGALAVWNEWLACMGIVGAGVGEVTGFKLRGCEAADFNKLIVLQLPDSCNAFTTATTLTSRHAATTLTCRS